MSSKKAVFLDRDGVINTTYWKDGKPRAPAQLNEFEFFPLVKEAVDELKRAGFLTIVVTNQPDVARGWQKKEIVDSMNAKVLRDLHLDDLKVCFHLDQDQCACRKPKAGMLIESAQTWGIDLSRSYMIGDRFSDLEAGNAAGCASILVGPGDAPVTKAEPMPADEDNFNLKSAQALPRAAAQVDSLYQAAQWILKHELNLAK